MNDKQDISDKVEGLKPINGFPERMEDISTEAALRIIEASRSKLIRLINDKMDELKDQVINGWDSFSDDGNAYREREYPLRVPSAIFKGTKPTAVIFAGERVEVHTWRSAYTEILKYCNDNEESHNALMSYRNMILGRKRTILSDNPNRMNIPIMVADKLYVEAYFDTESLLRTLTSRILDEIHYDYSKISISVINKNSNL